LQYVQKIFNIKYQTQPFCHEAARKSELLFTQTPIKTIQKNWRKSNTQGRIAIRPNIKKQIKLNNIYIRLDLLVREILD